MQGDYYVGGRSRPREALQCLLERGDRLVWIKQPIRGGGIRSIQHSVLTTAIHAIVTDKRATEQSHPGPF